MTKIKRLKQDNESVYPVTLANAVLYNDTDVNSNLNYLNKNVNILLKKIELLEQDSKINNGENFGGILNFTLGSDADYDYSYCMKVINTLNKTVFKYPEKHYNIIIYDTIVLKFFTNCLYDKITFNTGRYVYKLYSIDYTNRKIYEYSFDDDMNFLYYRYEIQF